MSLSKKIVAGLDEHGGPNLLLACEDGPNRLTLDIELATPVGVSCRWLEFVTSARSAWSTGELKAWGDRIAARVTYLMEPLVVLEADAEEIEVSLRSKVPTTRDDRRSYYEIRLNRAGMLRMERIAYDEVARTRKSTAFQLTREILERLIDDLVASVG
jgi:hypothetical protein